MRFKLSLVPKVLAAAALATAILAPPAAGSRASPHFKLAVIPLPQSVIGSVAQPLHLTDFSGPVPNSVAPNKTMGYSTPGTFKRLGRVSGYLLEYGVMSSGGSGVTQVLTGVEQYKSMTAAKHGLAFWKKDDALYRKLNQGTFSVTNALVKLPAIGKARFSYLTSYNAANITPLWTVDERFVDGKYVLQVQVSAGTEAAAKTLAPTLAKKLDARLKLALKGRLHAKPPKLNAPRNPGKPIDGPELSLLALTTTDLTGPVKVQQHRYFRNLAAVSDYGVVMEPAGPFDLLGQDVLWYGTANEAAFRADFTNAANLTGRTSVELDLSSVGHGAQGFVNTDWDVAQFSLTVGRLDVLVFVANEDTNIQVSELQPIAQTLADRLDTVYTG